MQLRQLGNTTLHLSSIGFGASTLGNAFGPVDPAQGVEAVHFAIDQGINFFDVSPYYGLTLAETRLGEALEGRRHQVGLSTKCGRYGADEFDFSPARITAGLEASLGRLKTDHVDLLLAHDVEFGDFDRIAGETIPAMRALQAQGKTRYIGVSGYPLPVLTRMMETVPLDAVLSYCHYNPLSDDLADALLPLADRLGVGVINASPLHMGILAGGTVPDWHPAPPAVRAAGVAFAAACKRHGLSPAAVALHASLAHPYIASTLIGIASRDQVTENLGAATLQLPEDLRRELEGITSPVRNITWDSGR